jgi:F0F1-type ATP synthase membrane subunit c/vacuolar-type H+-ATPase subunit K
MKRQRQSGFTLIELGLVTGLSVMIAGLLIGMFQAHVQMLNQALKNNFLAGDAPFIGLLLTRTLGNAEDYRIYSTGAVARASGAPSSTLTGSAVQLWMRQPNSTFRQAVVSFETAIYPAGTPAHQALYFYLASSPATTTTPATYPSTPTWELAGGWLTAATFSVSLPTTSPYNQYQLVATNPSLSGVLIVILTGSWHDWYAFSAEKK